MELTSVLNPANDNANISTPERLGLIEKLSLEIISNLENFFYYWGKNIAQRPFIFISACVLITAFCGIGLINFTIEDRPDKLWIPLNSDFAVNTDWLRENFPSPIRFHYAIIKAPNVLDPTIIKLLYEIHKGVSELKVSLGSPESKTFQWKDVCFKLPVTKFTSENDFNEDDPTIDPSFSLGQELYCELLSNLDEECWESNLSEMWNYDEIRIKNLTKDDILSVISKKSISPIFGRGVNYSNELGDTKRNSNGEIIGAGAIMLRWFAKINQTALKTGEMLYDLGTGEGVDLINFEWENSLVQFFQEFSMPNNTKLYFNVARSFGDISQTTIWNDAYMLAAGFSIVFAYVILMFGRCNHIEQRPMLSLAGLAAVGMGSLVSYGICGAFGIIYGPVHNLLPFLLMGIGIDDIFVCGECWHNLNSEEKKLPLDERMGFTLRSAGVSITVTSLTDFVVFIIGAFGASTVPALASFCTYAAFGILATYIFQATFFIGCFAIDQKRIESKRNAFLPCIKHKDFVPNKCSQQNLAKRFIEKVYCNFLFTTVTKTSVISITLVFVGVNLWGISELRQEFNPIWFLPQDSYAFQYFMAREQYFPEVGEEGFILISNVPLPENLQSFENLINTLENEMPNIYGVESWYSEFKSYVKYNFKKNLANESLSSIQFHRYLGRFLFSPFGSQYRGRMKLNGSLSCGDSSAPSIMISIISFKFKPFKNPKEQIPVMNKLKKTVRDFEASIANNSINSSSSRAFAWSFAFAGWETDELITAELWRNMALAMACVLGTVLILIANFRACLLIFCCVFFTLIDVGGSMKFWGLTIDTLSCVDLVLAIGLCVDYSVHIGHAFMTCSGTRTERAKKTLINIGPAVVNGGFSTFLAFVLLINSQSHVFITFFKIFFLVVFYGLFHGLFFLPVILSLIGPSAYSTANKRNANHEQQTMPLNSMLGIGS